MIKNQELMRIVAEIKLKYGLTQAKIANVIGTSPQYLSDCVNGRHPFTIELRRRLMGKFTDITSLNPKKDIDSVEQVKPNKRVGIPLVSQYAYAGYLSGYGDPEYMDSLPMIDFTPDREMTGNWLAFEVRGDSMDDGTKQGYVQGEIVICREIEPHLWRDYKLHFNQRDFVIVHEDGILLKRVIEHDVATHTIVIHSLNHEYPDRTINLSQVRKIFSVVESRIQRKR